MIALNLGLTTADTIVFIGCALLGIRGALKGFAWQTIRTLGLAGALWGATRFHGPVGTWLDESFSWVPSIAAPVVAWLAILVAIVMLFAFLAHMARGAVRTARLSAPDRLLGFALGAVMGLLFCAVGFVVWGHLIVGEAELQESLEGSTTARGMAEVIDFVEPLFPDEVRERFRKSLDALGRAGR